MKARQQRHAHSTSQTILQQWSVLLLYVFPLLNDTAQRPSWGILPAAVCILFGNMFFILDLPINLLPSGMKFFLFLLQRKYQLFIATEGNNEGVQEPLSNRPPSKQFYKQSLAWDARAERVPKPGQVISGNFQALSEPSLHEQICIKRSRDAATGQCWSLSASHSVSMRRSLTIPLTAVPGALSDATSRPCFHTWDLNRDLPDLVSKNTVNNLRVFPLVYFSLGCRGWDVEQWEMVVTWHLPEQCDSQ